MNILAIDQGTSSTKAMVVDDAGRVLAEASAPVETRTLGVGAIEQDPEQIWQSVVGAGRAALDGSAAAIGAVGLANQGETVLQWDRASGRPLSPAVSWQDRRAADVCRRLAAHADELLSLTGLPLDPYFAAPKMAWLSGRQGREGVRTTTDVWLLHRMAGLFVTDAATASRTLLLDLDRVQWSPRACSLFGIGDDELPAIADCAGVVGETSTFGPRLPVAGIAVDQQAALFGEGCLDAGDAKCTYGTGAFLLATLGAEPARSRAGLVTCVAWQLDGRPTYCLDGQVYTVGAAVDWLRRIGLIAEPADLDVLAAGVKSANGVVFVPALAGLAAPFWEPEAKGAFVGLSLATDKPELVRAFLEGIAAQVAWLARSAGQDLGRTISRLRADGGLTRSRELMQLQADLLQAPVEVYPSPHATALGVAALTRLGVSAARDMREAVGAWKAAAVYEPRMSADEAEEKMLAWRRAAEAVAALGSGSR